MRSVGTWGNACRGLATVGVAAVVFSASCNARGGGPVSLAQRGREELRVAVPRAMTATVGTTSASLKEGGGALPGSSEPGYPAARQFVVQLQAVVDEEDSAKWGPACLIQHNCLVRAPDLPRCTDGGNSRWRGVVSLVRAIFTERRWWGGTALVRRPSDVLAVPSPLEGKVIRVRGRLGVGPIWSTKKDCGHELGHPRCCNGVGGEVIVSDGVGAIRIDGMYCHGDESRSCCNVPAYGQEVVTSGTLLGDSTNYNASDENRWHLANATVCNVDAH